MSETKSVKAPSKGGPKSGTRAAATKVGTIKSGADETAAVKTAARESEPVKLEANEVSMQPVPATRARRRARMAKFSVGSVVRHKFYPFRGVVFDIDPVFDNTEEWWMSIPPELRPKKNQPFYHLLAENSDTEYIAYVSEQNLLADKSGEPLRHPKLAELFVLGDDGQFRAIYYQPH